MIKRTRFLHILTKPATKISITALVIGLCVLLMPEAAYANVNFNCGGDGPVTNFFPDLGCMIGQLFLSIASVFAYICGNILDLVVKFFVFEMSTTLESSSLFVADGDVPVYRQLWFLVRDFANLVFIFALIYAALSMIFNIKGPGKKIIPQLIIVAILMNFSLFFVQVATDFSNYIAYQFFTAVEVNVVPNANSDEGAVNDPDGDGFVVIGTPGNGAPTLSDIIMNVTKVTALVASPADLQTSQDASGTVAGQPGFAFGFFASIFVIIAGLVMLAGALLLFIRFFLILLFMIGSPIALAASIVESGGSGGIFKGWFLNGLKSQLAFAPAYFGLMYFALQILQTLSADAGLGSIDAGNSLAYWVRNAFIFMVSSGFLITAIYYAKKMSLAGSDWAKNIVKKGTGNYGRNLATKLGNSVQRNTIGKGGALVGRGYKNVASRASYKLDQWQKRDTGFGKNFADIYRGSSTLDKVARGTVRAGAGIMTLGASEAIRSAAKETNKAALRLEDQSRKKKFGGVSIEDREREDRETQNLIESGKYNMRLNELLEKPKANQREIGKLLSSLSVDQIKELDAFKDLRDERSGVKKESRALAAGLSDSKVAKLLEDNNLADLLGGEDLASRTRDNLAHFHVTDSVITFNGSDVTIAESLKEAFSKANLAGLTPATTAIGNAVELKKAINDFQNIYRETSEKQLEQLEHIQAADEDNRDHQVALASLTKVKFDKLLSNTENLNPTQKENIRSTRKNGLLLLSDTKEGSEVLLDTMRGELKQLPGDVVKQVFTHNDILKNKVAIKDLTKINSDESKTNAAQVKDIRNKIDDMKRNGDLTPGHPLYDWTEAGKPGEWFGI